MTTKKWEAHVYLADGHPRPLALVSYDTGKKRYFSFEGAQHESLFMAHLAAHDYVNILNADGHTPKTEGAILTTAKDLQSGRFATADEIEKSRISFQTQIPTISRKKPKKSPKAPTP